MFILTFNPDIFSLFFFSKKKKNKLKMCRHCRENAKCGKRSKSVKEIHHCDLPLTICKPGCYKLSENLRYKPLEPNTNAITIEASDVILDFDCYRLYQDSDSIELTRGVVVTGGNNNIQFFAKGGSISGFQGWGIDFEGPHDDISISGLKIENCGTDERVAILGFGGYPVDGGVKLGVIEDVEKPTQLVSNVFMKNLTVLKCKNQGVVLGLSNNFVMEDSTIDGTYSEVITRLVRGLRVSSQVVQDPDPSSNGIVLRRVNIQNTNCRALRSFAEGTLGAYFNSSVNVLLKDCAFQNTVGYLGEGQGGRALYVCHIRISGTSDYILDGCTMQTLDAGINVQFPQALHSSANTQIPARAARGPPQGGLQRPFNRIFKNCVVSSVKGSGFAAGFFLNYGSKILFDGCAVQDILQTEQGSLNRIWASGGYVVLGLTDASGGNTELNKLRGDMSEVIFKDCTCDKVVANSAYAGGYLFQGGIQPKFRDGKLSEYLVNIFSVAASSNVVTINEDSHGRTTGDTIGLWPPPNGANSNLNGLSKSELTGSHVITVTSPDTYTITVATPSSSAESDFGGTWLLGKVLTNPLKATAGSSIVEVTEPNHGRKVGAFVGLYNFPTIQGIPEFDYSRFAFQVHSVIDANTYTVQGTANAAGSSPVGGEGGDVLFRSLELSSPGLVKNMSFIRCSAQNIRSNYSNTYNDGNLSVTTPPIAGGIWIDQGRLFNYGYTFGEFDSNYVNNLGFYALPEIYGNVYIEDCRLSDIHGGNDNGEDGVQYSAGITLLGIENAQVYNNSITDCDNGIVLSGGTDQWDGKTLFTKNAIVDSNRVDNSQLMLLVKEAQVLAANTATLTLYSTVAQAGLAAGQTITVSGVETGIESNPFVGTFAITSVGIDTISYSVVSEVTAPFPQNSIDANVFAPQSTKSSNYLDVPGDNVFVDNKSAFAPSSRNYINVADVAANGNRSF